MTKSQVTQARQSILRSAGRFWSAADLPLASSTRQHLLAELAHRGELSHVRRGLYWRGRKTPLGMSPPSPEALVEELVGKLGVGPAGLSAAHRLRLSTQVPRKTHIAVPHRPPTSSGPITFVSRAARSRRATAALTAIEVALLEVLDDWSRVIEVPLPDAWRRLLKAVKDGEVSAARLAEASGTEPAPARVRLSALLTQAGFADHARTVPRADPRTARQALPRELAAAVA
ncbi:MULTISPECIES: hypothetical protein [unclassified Crossiella]|uniref:hypothetical protein n=1 Tax=unclassified Crossiella TaxID=2620835 RepID=UPI001FFF4E99|nr:MULTISPECIES: hypothetical protein [unclassified Crossiella]MCK2242440.1 hypothetical protein [Crossiella sp. S99.2]MCK2254529.1 hypothetical protein [Crossiella sp. S99.1]